jgi:Transposase DDE domain group 1
VQTFRSLGLPKSVREQVQVRERERGLRRSLVESFVILNAAGGECVDDFERLRGDPGLAEMVGHELPSPSAALQFLYAFQPMLAVWAEIGLVFADQFRDGNVPAQMEPLPVARRAFAALPSTVKEYYYRGDSACHESGLVNWLRDEQREGGPVGRIGFAISARMSNALHAAIQAVPEKEWKAYGEEHPTEIRECADVPFVPSEKSEKKDSQPLRFVAIRIRRKQGELFEDASAVRHFACMPSKYFGVNATWLRLAVISDNVLTAMKRLALPADILTARPKRLRFLLFNMPGRLAHHARSMLLRLAAVAEWIEMYRQGLRQLALVT